MYFRDGRILSEPFIKLPSKKDLPDYYDVIKQPMDFKRIKQKLKENKYGTIEEINSDINILCNNAQIYNMDGSLVSCCSRALSMTQVPLQIFLDSVVLKSVWSELKDQYVSENGCTTPAYSAHEHESVLKDKGNASGSLIDNQSLSREDESREADPREAEGLQDLHEQFRAADPHYEGERVPQGRCRVQGAAQR